MLIKELPSWSETSTNSNARQILGEKTRRENEGGSRIVADPTQPRLSHDPEEGGLTGSREFRSSFVSTHGVVNLPDGARSSNPLT
jgi:hypothetical protein